MKTSILLQYKLMEYTKYWSNTFPKPERIYFVQRKRDGLVGGLVGEFFNYEHLAQYLYDNRHHPERDVAIKKFFDSITTSFYTNPDLCDCTENGKCLFHVTQKANNPKEFFNMLTSSEREEPIIFLRDTPLFHFLNIGYRNSLSPMEYKLF